jgi:hypothetical protein
MRISEYRPELDRRSDTVDALSGQYERLMSLMLCAFSRGSQLVCSGVQRADRTFSMSLRCHLRLNTQSSASPATSVSRMRRLARWDASEEVEFLDVMADLSVHAVTTDGVFQARRPRTLVQVSVSARPQRAVSKRGGAERPDLNWMTAAQSAHARIGES